ncbi:NAD-dependent epimerase/dehydratase family protein [Neobacillus sp. YIM B06451]|uniref:NAD-dependent epimerase/dehydratase family protein n=1 Tax=Neobacillus sp. YIM B06451 TaxID=3070994 RepID=UPI00292F6DF3|nr:NAD-dependent epimerase/dehydratase family protein [Neobacillus sp. YIM B06451]
MNKKSALIAGATGLVGNELLQHLIHSQNYEKIYALVRRPLEVKHPNLVEVICDFERLEDVEQYFTVDDVFCTLGTIIKKAKTKEAMYRIDVEYPIAMAELAKKKGATHFLIVSSFNADKNSRIWYQRMKGELEEKLKKIPYEAMSIFQPSLLLGKRDEFRFFEKIAIGVVRGLSSIFGSQLRSRMGVDAKTVAAAMYLVAQKESKGIRTYSVGDMEDIQKSNPLPPSL